MVLKIASLNSGSNGNCYYVGHEKAGLLVDAGLSCRETEKRMRQLSLDIGTIKGILITHEHGDHIRGVTQLSKRHQIPVFISEGTRKYARILLYPHLANRFSTDTNFWIEDFEIIPFKKFHDAADPHSFLIRHAETCVGVFTDIGRVCDGLVSAFSQCHAAFLEANYETEMLDAGPYPAHLKKRIKGGWGHLSNEQAADLVREHRSSSLSQLVLTHLSATNNCPQRAAAHFASIDAEMKVYVASRFEASPIFSLDKNLREKGENGEEASREETYRQLSLF